MKEDTRRLRIEDIRKNRRIRGINTSAKEPQEEQHVRMRSGEHHDGLEKNKTKQAHCFGKTNSNRIKQADILTCRLGGTSEFLYSSNYCAYKPLLIVLTCTFAFPLVPFQQRCQSSPIPPSLKKKSSSWGFGPPIQRKSTNPQATNQARAKIHTKATKATRRISYP